MSDKICFCASYNIRLMQKSEIVTPLAVTNSENFVKV